jgi:hypothetical protein
MKKFLIGLMFIFLTACGQLVEPNYAGVLMENYGKDGKNDFSLQKGRVNTIAPGTELYQVPLWEQRANFEKPLNLKAADNTAFNSNPVYSYKIIEKRAIDVVFENKQLGSGTNFMGALENNILEPKIYDLMKEESRKYTTDELMANGGSLKFENAVQEIVKKALEDKGLELVTFSAQLNFSDKVTAKIDSRNEVNTNITVLDQKIAEQKKQNELEELIKQQNLIRSAGITQALLQQQFIEKWDGKTPLYGNSMPITLMKKE